MRQFLPIGVTDTHSGTLVMTRALAFRAFLLQTSPDFLFELELSLVAKEAGLRETDLPVLLYLAEEKRVKRMFKETFIIFHGLWNLSRRLNAGMYRSPALDSAATFSALGSAWITADDWGLSPGVNQGILTLAERGIVRRVSIMADTRFLREGLDRLLAVPGIRLGIHFNLTYGLEKSSPRALLLNWVWGHQKESLVKQIRSDLRSQLELLRRAGIKTAYLDGHHHIHLVPGMIDAISDLLKSEEITEIRLPYDPSLFFSKRFPLNILSLLAKRRIRKHGFTSLPCIYPRDAYFLDQGLLRRLVGEHPGTEIIVHPAAIDDVSSLEFPDTYSAERVTEFQALRMLAP